MDPQATWDALLEAWAAGNWSEVVELSEALLGWIRKGGFPPNTIPQPEMGAEWNDVVAVAACRFALDRATIVLSSPGNIPTDVPFTLVCASCMADGPISYADALSAGWQRIRYKHTGNSENFLGCCPLCNRAN